MSIVTELRQTGIVDFYVRVFASLRRTSTRSEGQKHEESDSRSYVYIDHRLLDSSDQIRLLHSENRGPLTVALSGHELPVEDVSTVVAPIPTRLYQRQTMAIPNFKQSWDRVSHIYIVDLDTRELLIARHHHRIRKFDLPAVAAEQPQLPDDWLDQIRLKPVRAASGLMPISRLIRQHMEAELATKGYVLRRWFAQRSGNNIIGEVADERTPKQLRRIVKCFIDFEAYQDAEAWQPFDGKLLRECRRELSVAQRIHDEAQASDNIVGICDVFQGKAVVAPLWALVMEKAVTDLETHLDEEEEAAEAQEAEATAAAAATAATTATTTRKVREKEGQGETSSPIEGAKAEAMKAEQVFQQIERALKWAFDVCNALSWFHSRQLVFMDLKLSNVLLTQTGDAVLCDFESVAQRVAPSTPNKEQMAKWVEGWEPTRYTFLANGFDLVSGQTTIYQDYYCLARLLRSMLQRVQAPKLTPSSSLYTLLASAARRNFATVSEEFFTNMSNPEVVDSLTLSQISDMIASVFVSKLREYHRLYQTLTSFPELDSKQTLDLMRQIVALNDEKSPAF